MKATKEFFVVDLNEFRAIEGPNHDDRFRRIDRYHNGRITLDEAKTDPTIRRAMGATFNGIDTKHQGFMTPQNNASGQPSQTDVILGRPADQAPRDIVSAVAPDQIDPALRPRYQQLLQLRDYLIDQETDLQAQGEEVQPKDRQQADAESATVINLRDMAFARAMTYNELIKEVNEALGRIERGTYGRCELTGKPIPAHRLDAIPWTRFTAEAEAQLESQGQAPAQFRFPEAGRLKGSSETIELGGDDHPQTT